MQQSVCFLWLGSLAGDRLSAAQLALEASICAHNLQPLRIRGGRKLKPIGEVLAEARQTLETGALIWVNSDVLLTRDMSDVPDKNKVYGFHRREVPSGEITRGVDGYYIPLQWWDTYLSKDIPTLYLGASYVDWWISRAMQKIGAYENLAGYLDHVTHPQSDAAGKDSDPYYQMNFRSYNCWARRNGLNPIPAPPFLIPKLGHVWGARDALSKLTHLLRRKLTTPNS